MNKFNIPNWVDDGHGFGCDDVPLHTLGFLCELYGVDLPRFDIWLQSLPDCPMKDEMIEIRDDALNALQKNEHKVTKLALSLMHIMWKNDLREEFLLPKACRGEKVIEGAAKGGKTRDIWKSKSAEMQTKINEISNEHPKISYAEVMRKASKKHGYSMSAIKRYTKNPNPSPKNS